MAEEAGWSYWSLVPRFKPGGFKAVDNEAEMAGRRAGNRLGDSIGRNASRRTASLAKNVVAPLGAAFAAVKVADFFKDAVTGASDLNETINLNKVIFKDDAKAILAWSKTSATSFGLSRKAALTATGTFGDMFKQLGFGRKEAVKNSKAVVGLAADLGSFKNLKTEDVLERISAGFRGEYDSLQLLVPNINAARVAKEALTKTGKASEKQLTAEQKAAAVLAIVQKDSAAAMGDFARTSDGLANSQKILGARFDDTRTKLGQGLLPIAQDFTQFLLDEGVPALEDFGDWFTREGVPAIQEFRDVAGPLAKSTLPLLGTGLEVVGDTLKVIAPAVKSIVDSFNSLPKAAQTAILLGAGSAYLGGKVTGGLAAGAGKNAARRTAVEAAEKNALKAAPLAGVGGPQVAAGVLSLFALYFGSKQAIKNSGPGFKVSAPGGRIGGPGGGDGKDGRSPEIKAYQARQDAARQAAADIRIDKMIAANQRKASEGAKQLRKDLLDADGAADTLVSGLVKLDGTDANPQAKVGGLRGALDGLAGMGDMLVELDKTRSTPTVRVGGLTGALRGLAKIGDRLAALAAGEDFATGGYTGRGGKYQPAGIVHADEFVVRSEARRRAEAAKPGALAALNRTGKWPGYADGGQVGGAISTMEATRPIYTDTGMLLGWMKQVANGELRLLWNTAAEDVRYG